MPNVLTKYFAALRAPTSRPTKPLSADDIGLPQQCVHAIHCEQHPSKGVVGLPRAWQDSWNLLQGSVGQQQLDAILSKLPKFPLQLTQKQIVICSEFQRLDPDNQQALAALEVLCEAGPLETTYDIHEFIGGGAFGKVFYATDRRSGQLVAIKQCSPQFLKTNPYIYLNELIALRLGKHRNVVSFISSFMARPFEVTERSNTTVVKTSRTTATRVPFFVMELMETSLYYLLIRIYRDDGYMGEDMVTFVMRELLTGVEFLHSKGILHRDLKSENVLVSQDGAVKIADFGLSCRFTHRAEQFSACKGSLWWMPPEMIRHCPYTSKADIWSLGIVLIELLDGCPHGGNGIQQEFSTKDQMLKRPAPRPKRAISESMREVLQAMLNKRGEKRLACSAILQLPAFENVIPVEEFAAYVNAVLRQTVDE